MFNPKHLRAFITVARAGSVIRSSKIVHRAQSAVTRSIKELERELGVILFERRPQGMLMTEFGRTLLQRVDRALAEMETARQGFQAALPPKTWNEHASIFSLSASHRRLAIFVELVEQRHMGAVAESLDISQPAVSQALREVETSLGVELLVRSPGGLLPTPLGALLAMHIRRALAELRAAEVEIGSLQGAVSGRVVVGTLSRGRARLLPHAIVRLTESYPHLTVSTIEGSFEHLATRLRAGDIDFMIGALRPPEHTVGFVREVVAHDVLALMVRQSHPFVRKKTLEFAHIEDAQWVLPPRGTPTREQLENAFRQRGLREPKVVVETADLAITRGLLLESNMMTAVSPHLFQHEVETRAISILPLELPETRRGIGILQRSASSPSLAARLLMDNIREIGKL